MIRRLRSTSTGSRPAGRLNFGEHTEKDGGPARNMRREHDFCRLVHFIAILVGNLGARNRAICIKPWNVAREMAEYSCQNPNVSFLVRREIDCLLFSFLKRSFGAPKPCSYSTWHPLHTAVHRRRMLGVLSFALGQFQEASVVPMDGSYPPAGRGGRIPRR